MRTPTQIHALDMINHEIAKLQYISALIASNESETLPEGNGLYYLLADIADQIELATSQV